MNTATINAKAILGTELFDALLEIDPTPTVFEENIKQAMAALKVIGETDGYDDMYLEEEYYHQ